MGSIVGSTDYRVLHRPVEPAAIIGMWESLQIRDWQRAQSEIREWEAEDRRATQPDPKTSQMAWQEFLADIEARTLSAATIRKYDLLSRQMQEFADRRGFRFIAEFDLEAAVLFRAGWKDGPLSSTKKLERLRTFFRLAQKRKWTSENPASDLKSPKLSICPTMPYTSEEMMRILAAMGLCAEEMPSTGKENARRIRALVLLLRYSGMRIGDAVGLSVDRIKGNRLFLYTKEPAYQ